MRIDTLCEETSRQIDELTKTHETLLALYASAQRALVEYERKRANIEHLCDKITRENKALVVAIAETSSKHEFNRILRDVEVHNGIGGDCTFNVCTALPTSGELPKVEWELHRRKPSRRVFDRERATLLAAVKKAASM